MIKYFVNIVSNALKQSSDKLIFSVVDFKSRKTDYISL